MIHSYGKHSHNNDFTHLQWGAMQSYFHWQVNANQQIKAHLGGNYKMFGWKIKLEQPGLFVGMVQGNIRFAHWIKLQRRAVQLIECDSHGDLVPITEPALLMRCAWESHSINCTAYYNVKHVQHVATNSCGSFICAVWSDKLQPSMKGQPIILSINNSSKCTMHLPSVGVSLKKEERPTL